MARKKTLTSYLAVHTKVYVRTIVSALYFNSNELKDIVGLFTRRKKIAEKRHEEEIMMW